jgi:hypothetical protein
MYDAERSGRWIYRATDLLNEQYQADQSRSTASKNPAPSTPTSTEDTQVGYNRAVDAADNAVRAELLKRETERLMAEKIALVDAYGDDNFANGTVIRFEKKYSKTGTVYTYTGVKYTADGADEGTWRTSSHYDGDNNRNWSSLVQMLVEGPFPTASIEVMKVDSTYPAQAPTATKADAKA